MCAGGGGGDFNKTLTKDIISFEQPDNREQRGGGGGGGGLDTY